MTINFYFFFREFQPTLKWKWVKRKGFLLVCFPTSFAYSVPRLYKLSLYFHLLQWELSIVLRFLLLCLLHKLFILFFWYLSNTAMASSVSTFLFINIIIVLFINIIIVSLFPTLPPTVKLPFHPKDILPVLPRQVSRPILYALYNPEDPLPAFVGNANSTNRFDWEGACFQKNTAWLELHNNTGSPFGGGTLHIKVCTSKLLILRCLICWVLEIELCSTVEELKSSNYFKMT